MEGADALALIAEVGIAIAGFAGVVAALRAPAGTLGGYAALRIGSLLGQSASVVLVALLPFALHSAGLSISMIWALSSALMVFFNLLILVVPLRISRRVLPAAVEDRSPGIPLIGPILIVLTVVVGVLQLANVVFIRQLWPLYVGLLAVTAISLFVFAYVLFAPSRAEVSA